MKTAILISTTFFLLAASHAQTTWQKRFLGNTVAEGGFVLSILQNPDKGFAFTAGASNYNAAGPCLVKIDSLGNLLWSNIYRGSGQGINLKRTSNGGYIIAGNTTLGMGNYDMSVIKTDSNGTIQWAKAFGTVDNDEAYSIVEPEPGKFVFAGYMTLDANDSLKNTEYISLNKMDSAGNILWNRLFGDTQIGGQAFSMQETYDHGFILAGLFWNSGLSDGVFLLKTDSAGNFLWAKNYTGSPSNAYSVIQTQDSGFVLAGQCIVTSSDADALLIKTDAAGNPLWSKRFGGGVNGIDEARAVRETSDGGLAFFGTTSSTFNNNRDGYLAKTDANGSLLWSQTYGGSLDDDGFCAEQTADNGFILGGSLVITGSQGKLWLIKTDSAGNNCLTNGSINIEAVNPITTTPWQYADTFAGADMSVSYTVSNVLPQYNRCSATTTGLNKYEPAAEINIYPNPFAENLNIETQGSEPVEIVLYDITSRILLRQQVIKYTTINTASLAQGIYGYDVKNKNGVIKTGMVVKQNP
jgi:hypothetical protein